MKRTLILAAACLAASLAQAAPPIPLDQLQLRVTYRPCDAPGVGLVGNSMYNCRFFDGSVYAPQINNYCWARFPRGSSIPSAWDTTRQTRMVSPIPGSTYLLASGGTLQPYTRYDFDGTNPVDAGFPDAQLSESFDWVDNNTIIATDYTSGNRGRLYLVDVTAEPFALTKNTTWNVDGYVTNPSVVRIRNVRVGQTNPNYAYYGNNQVSVNPKVYAINLATGVSTEIGQWDGALKEGTAGGAATGSWGLWTVVERGGYLYLQSSDDGIQVYSMTGPTTMGAMVASYSKEQLQAITGGGSVPYYGFDVAADDAGLILGDFLGNVYELQRRVPIASGQLQLRANYQPYADLGQTLGSMYNPRTFDGNIYANEIGDAAHRCFARYASGSSTMVAGVIPAINEHRMVAPFRGAYSSTYMMGTGGWDGIDAGAPTFVYTFTRYNFDGSSPVTADAIDNQVVESFDWVDDDTIISTCYVSGNRKRLYLTDVTAEPFALTRNTTWNANGYVETTVTTRIRNVRVGETYSNYAYYGDNQVSVNPKVYALNLTTGVETQVGSWNGTLKAGTAGGAATGSWGLWTVVERGGYLYLQSSDDGIQVYKMTDATTMSSLYTAHSKAELDAVTTGTPAYYGFDVGPSGASLLLGGYTGAVYELESGLRLSISRSGTDIILSWPAYHTGVVVESSTTLDPGSFADLPTQPATVVVAGLRSATIPADSSVPVLYRLRK